jgi:hypothetical protein
VKVAVVALESFRESAEPFALVLSALDTFDEAAAFFFGDGC